MSNAAAPLPHPAVVLAEDIVVDVGLQNTPAVIDVRDGSTTAPQESRHRSGRRIAASTVVAIVAYVLVLLALSITDSEAIVGLGLVEAMPTWGLVSAVVAVGATSWTILGPRFHETSAAVLVTVHTVIISAAPALVYPTPRYSWTYKHIGIVDYILRNGGVDTDIDVLAVYHNWPGFFAGSATLVEWLGAEDAIVIAQWTPIVLNVATMLVLVLFLGQFTESRRAAWFGVLLFFLSNWIGQDYFSPQALGLVLYLAILGLAMRHYRAQSAQPPTVAVHLAMVLMIATLVASHQLTPLVLLVALGVLLVWRRTARVLLPIGALALALGAWFTSWARPFVQANIGDELASLGSPVSNASETLTIALSRSQDQLVVAWAGRGLVAGVLLLAGVGFVVRFWRGHGYRAPLAMLFAPVALTVMQFGGEILFRMVLFMLPMLSLLAADALLAIRPTGLRTIVGTAVCVGCLGLFSIAYYGKDFLYTFTADELAVASELMETAPEDSLLIEASRNYPAQFRNYDRFTYVAIDREGTATQLEMVESPADRLHEWLDNDRYAATYILLTRSQARSTSELGLLPPGFVEGAEASLRSDDRFAVLIEGDDAVVFALAAGDE